MIEIDQEREERLVKEEMRWEFAAGHPMPHMIEIPITTRRGFANVDKTTLRAVSSKGGKSAHAQGRAHEFDSDSARIAGRKGGRPTKEGP
jgi:general stress protein YciG